MSGIIESVGESSKYIIQWISNEIERLASNAVCNGITEGLEKSREKLFSLAISIALLGTGFFITLWGIATAIDTFFAMRGFGYVFIGILSVLTGALVFKK